jgi:hypothetical protein
MKREPSTTGLTQSQLRRAYAREARRRKRRRYAIFAAILVALAATGAAIGLYVSANSSNTDLAEHGTVVQPTAVTTQRSQNAHSTTSTSGAGRASRAKRVLFTPSDRANFAGLEARLGGASGVAVSGLGRDQAISELGSLREGVAWSTIKVPIAIAVEDRFGGAPPTATQNLLVRAITASDNAAAEALWSSLGPPEVAGAAVQRVLGQTGDTATHVETRVLRPGFTSFGQTVWSLAAQQRFISGLSCLPRARPVLALMRQVEADQQWGLGTLGSGTAFKGGWGPDSAGRYLVRQMGIFRVGGRPVAVSIATMPSDGTFGTGTANLGAIASWLASHLKAAAVPPARC